MNGSDYNAEIFMSIKSQHWLQVNCFKKLYNNDIEEKGEEVYDPS